MKPRDVAWSAAFPLAWHAASAEEGSEIEVSGPEMRSGGDVNGLKHAQTAHGSWERRPGESRQAHRALEAYLGLGQSRSLRAVAKRVGCHLSLIKRWSSKHDWRLRACAWDQSQTQEVAAQTRADQAAYERRLHNAEQLEKVAMAGLRSLLVRDRETEELRFDQRLKPADIASLIRVACQMMPTPPISPEEEGADEEALADLTDADLLRLRSLLEQEDVSEEEGEDREDGAESKPATKAGSGGRKRARATRR